jgi:hypothetical protein
MNFTNLCGPVVLYLGFSLIQIIIDIFRQHFNVALLKFIVMIVFGTVLNILCSKNLTIVAWLLVFIPFIFMTVITTLLLIAFGLDPQGNLIDISNNNLVNPSNNLDTLPCNEIYSENLCLNNKCEWVQMEGEPTSGICKFSNKFGKRIGREIGNEIAYSLINNQNQNNIGGDPATWSPSDTNNQNIGGDPATWGPPETNNQNENVTKTPSYIKDNMGENYKN